MPIIHDIKPRTPEWYRFRESHLGGSEASAVMKACPWMTPFQLWQLKTGRGYTRYVTKYMRRGLNLESAARGEYTRLTGINMPEAVVSHSTIGFMSASLDGFNVHRNIALEIKCPGKVNHSLALAGKIPRTYKWQLVHAGMVADVDRIDYFSFDGTRGVIIPFYRDIELERTLLREETKFWELVKANIPPPILKLQGRRISPAFEELCNEFLMMKLRKQDSLRLVGGM